MGLGASTVVQWAHYTKLNLSLAEEMIQQITAEFVSLVVFRKLFFSILNQRLKHTSQFSNRLFTKKSQPHTMFSHYEH